MDLALAFNAQTATMDLVLGVADLQSEQSLATAMLLSLMCDRLAQPHEVDAGADRRGWWADTYAEQEGDRFGSRLWLLAREKQRQSAVQRAIAYAQEALKWLVDDGLASAVDVLGFVPRTGWLVLQVAVSLNGSSRRYRFEWSDESHVWRLAGELQ